MAKTKTLLAGTDGSLVRRSVLSSGVRVITEKVPGVHSASIGIWVDAGSRDEKGSHTGAAHYLEHLLFKGTSKRSALEIAAAIESVGGDINAFTSKEHTCYYAKVLAVDLPLAIDVLCDVVTDAQLTLEDIEGERGVILEEIAMVDDDPSDLVHDQFARTLFGDTALGRPILGTAHTIVGITRRSIINFYAKFYQSDSLVVAIAGDVDHSRAVRLVEKALEASPKTHLRNAKAGLGSREGKIKAGTAISSLDTRKTEQAHVVMGTHGMIRGDDRRFTGAILSTVLGGGMSSRLFQAVREQRGLAYSVFAYSQSFRDSGIFGIYAGCIPTKLDQVLDVCQKELADLVDIGVTSSELRRAKGQVKGGTVLGQEDTGARMSRIAKSELYQEELLCVEDVLARVDQVEVSDVNAMAREFLSEPLALSVIGPYKKLKPPIGFVPPTSISRA
ncbi:MAG: pitrilysin family protein [Candidatus Nanopelagicales bacterium]|jgi:predicted Zn-dependent peptidase|nr:insulinase family protein [Actinomycetota bacterium]NCG02875.1 insulinase family protein [Actinomycetales bacterium]MBT5183298.1 insulinase family protein [Actinomycetota bacterium]MBT5501331.1 insulinase family protein [Actinomycetota bacterium]MBT5807029.1 insulinase family protein [Actinomycetota bacterium]